MDARPDSRPNLGPDAGRGGAFAALVAVPFLFPLAGGPFVSARQSVAGGLCLLALFLVAPRARPARGLILCLGMAAACVLVSPRGPIAVWPVWAALVALAVAAWVGAGIGQARGAALASWPMGIVLAGCASAALGLVQYVGAADLLGGLAVVPAEGLGMAYGNLRQRNQLASLLCLALVAGLWLHGRASPVARGGLAAAALLLIAGLAASTSRTGLLQFVLIVAGAAWLAWRERREKSRGPRPWLPHPLWLLATLPLYALAAWLLPRLASGSGSVEGMMARLREGAPPGHSRLVLWRNVVELIAQHPWRGWGWGELSYAHYSHLYAGERFVEILDNAHNLPLHLAVTLGIPAAVAICGGFVWMVLRARPWAERDPARIMVWGLLGVIVLHSLLEYPLWYAPFQLVFGLSLGFLWPGQPRVSSKPNGPFAPVLPALAAIISIAFLVLVGWDYTRVSQIYLPRDERLPAWRTHTLDQLRGRSWFFGDAVKFAELTLTLVTRDNAAAMDGLAGEMLHFSPEPRVVVKRIQAASLLGHDDEVQAQLARFRAAYPEDYLRWLGGLPPP